jgi:hypothetical protein
MAVKYMRTPGNLRGVTEKENKKPPPNQAEETYLSPKTAWQRPRCQRLVLIDESAKAGLPAFQILFSLPKKSQWQTRKRILSLVYGGGSALVFHEIPYEALVSTLGSKKFSEKRNIVKGHGRSYGVLRLRCLLNRRVKPAKYLAARICE